MQEDAGALKAFAQVTLVSELFITYLTHWASLLSLSGLAQLALIVAPHSAHCFEVARTSKWPWRGSAFKHIV